MIDIATATVATCRSCSDSDFSASKHLSPRQAESEDSPSRHRTGLKWQGERPAGTEVSEQPMVCSEVRGSGHSSDYSSSSSSRSDTPNNAEWHDSSPHEKGIYPADVILLNSIHSYSYITKSSVLKI